MIVRLSELRSGALVSAFLLLPFLLLELLNNTATVRTATGRLVLFGLLWLVAVLFVAFAQSAVRTAREPGSITPRRINIYLRVAVAIVLACVWGSILVDQLPCFMGIPNCD